jgi:hypothetical protein
MLNIAFRTRQIDPHIGIMVKTSKPIKMVILGPAPKIIDLDSGTGILSMEMIFINI